MRTKIGEIVVYHTTEAQRKVMRENPACNVQDHLPAIIVAVWGETCVNLKVLCDGEPNLWVTSAVFGASEGQWDNLVDE